MTDLEKLQARIDSLDAAIEAVRESIVVERKMSHAKHAISHYTALDELIRVRTGHMALKTRMETVGR